jgi:hypothetical protein
MRLTAILALSLAACSSGGPASADAGSPSGCVRSDPSCAAPAPSYATTVHPIVEATCVNCHHPGSNLAQTSLATYEDVQLEFGAALGQVSSCLMPPAGYTLSTEDRAELLSWLACGAPDN